MNSKPRTPPGLRQRMLALALCAGFGLLHGPLGAQTAPPPSSMKALFDKAWALHAEALAAPARREAAAAQQALASKWTADAPSLELSLKSDRWNRNGGAREQELGVSVPLWLPGERGRSQALADSAAQALDSRLLAAQWRVAALVRDAWWTAQLARVDRDLASLRLQAAQRLSQDVGRRVKAGDLAKTDLLQAQSTEAAAEMDLAQAEQGLLQAVQILQGWGVDAEALGRMATAGLAEAQPPEASQEPEPGHPALAELAARAQVAQRALELAEVQKRANPELVLGTTRDRGAFGEAYGQTVTVGVRLPLGAPSAHRAKQATARAEQIEAEQLLAQERQQLRAALMGARARLASAQSALGAAERRAQASRETRAHFEKSFQLGETDLPTRLRIEQEAFEAERQQARAQNALHQAVSNLRQALGLLPQ
ncbi:TolC family protein [Inhella sp.]|uniref:TolC family protein n=1 Tax=Inhella sp. TaxID=1921806 RepID=UPI0035ADC324